MTVPQRIEDWEHMLDLLDRADTTAHNLREQLKLAYNICMHRNIVNNACTLKLGNNFCQYCLYGGSWDLRGDKVDK